MGSICGDLRLQTRKQLYSMIGELSRENNCLKSDLIRLEMLSNECQKYLHFLKTNSILSQTIDTSIEKHFIQQINDLKAINKCCIDLNDLTVNQNPNLNFEDIFVSIGCKISDESLEVLAKQQKDNVLQDEEVSEELDDNVNDIHEDMSDRPDLSTNKCPLIGPKSMTKRILKVIKNSNKCKQIGGRVGVSGSRETNTDKPDVSVEDSIGRRYYCNHNNCDNSYTHMGSLGRHKQLAHSDTTATTTSRVAVGSTNRRSKQDKRYYCEHINCGRVFHNHQHLVFHLKSHIINPLNRYVCDYKDCGQSFSNNHSLKRHQSSHLDKRFFCDHENCSAHFGDSHQLWSHRQSGHHLLHQPFNCGLNGCLFETTSRDDLEVHITYHSMADKIRDKQYVCDEDGCDKTFANRANFLKHKKRHQRKEQLPMDVTVNSEPTDGQSVADTTDALDSFTDQSIDNNNSNIDYTQNVSQLIENTADNCLTDYSYTTISGDILGELGFTHTGAATDANQSLVIPKCEDVIDLNEFIKFNDNTVVDQTMASQSANHIQLNIVYKCENCSQIFATFDDLNSHNMNQHSFQMSQPMNATNEPYIDVLNGSQDIQFNITYNCEDCNETFTTIEHLNNHNIIRHSSHTNSTTAPDAQPQQQPQHFDYISCNLMNRTSQSM